MPVVFSNRGIVNANSSPVAGGGGGSDGFPATADKYVSSTGSNGAAGTLGAPYATIAYALSQISNGQSVGVLSALTETLDLSSLSGGASGAYKSVVAIDSLKVITGTFLPGASAGSKYLRFFGLHFEGGANEAQCYYADYAKWIACGFFGGPTSGNTVTHVAGSNQLYQDCWFGGNGGRYASLCYQQTGTVYRRCVVRSDTWGSPADDGNPNGGIQIYSATNCARLNCIAVDCLPQRSNNEFLAVFPVTTNVGSSTGIVDIGCVASDNACPGYQVEGSSSATYTGTNNVAVRGLWGFIENLDSGGGSITINGGEYSNNDGYGLSSFGATGYTPTNINTSGNVSGNFNGVSAGSGCTTATPNMDTLLSAMKRIGVSESLYGESGWNVAQSEDLFPLPFETEVRTKFAALSTRGFCGGSYTLSSYLKRA